MPEVYEAEFDTLRVLKDRCTLTMRGRFTVLVYQSRPEGLMPWSIHIHGADGVLARAKSARLAKSRAGGFFVTQLTDWRKQECANGG